MDIDIEFIADFAEVVTLTLNAPVSKVKFLALLVHNSKQPGSWALMWPPRDVMMGVDKVEMHRKDKVLGVELTQLRNATHQFHLIGTTVTSDTLEINGLPVYPEALARWKSGLI